MAPGLTWANYGADGGDLITAAATGGVAHPTGYPVYLLLARIFQFLPVGSLAFRTNLLSVFCMALAVLLVYKLVICSLPAPDGYKSWMVALASSYAFGLAPLVWSQAVITEVYALHALFVVAILYISSTDKLAYLKQSGLDCPLGLLFGLATGNHVTSILALPILFFRKLNRDPNALLNSRLLTGWRLDFPGLLRQVVWMGIGLLVYLSLPLRSLMHPPINWGNPATLSGFIWLISGKLYQDQFFALTIPSILERCKVVALLLLGQFGIAGLVIGLLGLIVFFKPSRLYRNMLWMMMAFTMFSVIYATKDSFLYLIPAFLCFAICIGMGLFGLMDLFDQRFHQGSFLIGFIFIFVLAVQAANTWPQVDASHDQRAEQFGKDVLAQAPEHAIVFAEGDQAVFTLWYFHFALHERPDLAIVAADLLHFDWYQQNLLVTYPDLNVPGPFPFVETFVLANPSRPQCYAEYKQLAQIQCLPAKAP